MTRTPHIDAGARRDHRTACVVLAGFFCLCAAVAYQLCSLSAERRAQAQLKHEYPYPACMVHTGIMVPLLAEDEPRIDVRQLAHGQLYVPVESASFGHTTVQRSAFELLARFPHLDRLDFQDCRIDRGAMLSPEANARLTHLQFWRTPITLAHLRSISKCAQLEYLVLDGTDLKGNWLREVSALPNVKDLILNNADLSDGAADSLARMKALRSLQLSHAKTDSKLGPALASLENLECLSLCDTAFDDDGMKH
ncbi:MAG: hypothetical protein LLG00_08340 [Planctomycetaceae bacterium]|nr:hypothetical protein [Planctomycetaceae bacterium]